MIQCYKCGQGNALESNFCRFCGNRLPQGQQQNNYIPQPNGNSEKAGNYEITPPRPYSWKTDEFQLEKETSARKTQQINNFKPPAELNAPALHPLMTNQYEQQPHQQQQMAQYQQANMSYGYRCPRCATQLLPKIVRKISPVGWVLFAVLLVTFFPLFWIGFLVKEDTRICPVCNLRVK